MADRRWRPDWGGPAEAAERATRLKAWLAANHPAHQGALTSCRAHLALVDLPRVRRALARDSNLRRALWENYRRLYAIERAS